MNTFIYLFIFTSSLQNLVVQRFLWCNLTALSGIVLQFASDQKKLPVLQFYINVERMEVFLILSMTEEM